jgi:hypothetical protein
MDPLDLDLPNVCALCCLRVQGAFMRVRMHYLFVRLKLIGAC